MLGAMSQKSRIWRQLGSRSIFADSGTCCALWRSASERIQLTSKSHELSVGGHASSIRIKAATA